MALNHSIKNGINALATTAITGASGTTQVYLICSP